MYSSAMGRKKNKLEIYPDLMGGGMEKKKEHYKILPLLLDSLGRNKSKDHTFNRQMNKQRLLKKH